MKAVFKATNDLAHLTGIVTVRTREDAIKGCTTLRDVYREEVGCYLEDGLGLIGEGTLWVTNRDH